ncbi:hypothetical protein P7L75_04325 (plasmid) [Tistrella mobilis]|uniref:hypothetical protein n=1 Tax=Tistrella mobilis TaxID=171437 RepID=UPI0035578722
MGRFGGHYFLIGLVILALLALFMTWFWWGTSQRIVIEAISESIRVDIPADDGSRPGTDRISFHLDAATILRPGATDGLYLERLAITPQAGSSLSITSGRNGFRLKLEGPPPIIDGLLDAATPAAASPGQAGFFRSSEPVDAVFCPKPCSFVAAIEGDVVIGIPVGDQASGRPPILIEGTLSAMRRRLHDIAGPPDAVTYAVSRIRLAEQLVITATEGQSPASTGVVRSLEDGRLQIHLNVRAPSVARHMTRAQSQIYAPSFLQFALSEPLISVLINIGIFFIGLGAGMLRTGQVRSAPAGPAS